MSVAQILGMNQQARTATPPDSNSSDPQTTPSLPPLIKIDQTIPIVGYSAAMLENSNSVVNKVSENNHIPSITNGQKVTMNSDPGVNHPHYRPTIINLVAPPTPPISLHTSTQLSPSTPLDLSPSMPRPLVEPVDTDRPERMRDWLVRMIDSGRFPGLKWLDQEQMIFRVPWIHAKKRDYNQERDAALFREWAIHSGKYGDGSDVTTWKINFRCALNGLKDIIERRELEEPDCRVYQMLPMSTSARRRKRRRPGGFYSADPPGDFQPLPLDRDVRARIELPGMSAASSFTPPTIITPTSGGPPLQVVPLISAGTPLSPVGTPLGTPIRIVGSPTTPQNSQIGFIQKLRTIVPASISPVVTKHFDLTTVGSRGNSDSPTSAIGNNQVEGLYSSQPPTPHTPISPVALTHQLSPKVVSPPQHNTTTYALPSPHQHHTHTAGQTPSIALHPPLRTGPVYCPPPEFSSNPNAVIVRVLYGSITVHMEALDCSKGARIYYGPLHCRDVLEPQVEERLFGPLEAHQIFLSPRHPAPLAKEIFSNFKRGIVLEVEDECLYATALCRTVVYYGSSPVKYSNTLNKEKRTKIFNYAHRFTPSLKYLADGHGQPPKPYVVFSLGQPWGSDRPLSKNLVTVVVTHCKALNDLKVRNIPIHDELLFEAQEARDIRIIAPTQEDMEAEEFLNPKGDTPM